ncbi:MAG: SocA family protein [Betaproteobacteria bacterium]|nr:SocA family protein [Betaproteobacteria bacterium]
MPCWACLWPLRTIHKGRALTVIARTQFNERKVAQMAAYLISKEGERMSHLKLMKLLYLADREAMAQFGSPLSGDRLVSMDNGPVLSMTLNLMDGDVEPKENGWEAWISDKENHELAIVRPVIRESLDELSAADIDVLDATWSRFGHMSKWEIRNYTHRHCTEWVDPHGSSTPIEYEDVFIALGRTTDQAAELADHIRAEHSIDRLFASL